MARELALAGEVQASFLPRPLPEVPGWQVAVTLQPARETSGDFDDVIPLPDGRLGVLVADVVDKGVGAALFMALSWTLVRTYAPEHPDRPDLVLDAVNRRILADTQTGQFVSIFYGVLDPVSGELTYGNAGHCPAYLVGRQSKAGVQRLVRTGMALGVQEDATWERMSVQVEPGDVLALYTDGITEAHDGRGELFGEERLRASLRSFAQQPAPKVRDAVLAAVHGFAGGASAVQSDDIALVVVTRAAG
jgi:sigma-B regulation protein RsbU (phosphoserine phosphatase)